MDGPLTDSPDSNGSICADCGLCCDGTLHPYANVDKDEAGDLSAKGFALLEMDGGTCFRQPCPKLSGTCCTIYDRRPMTCRAYRCALLTAVDEGRVPVAVARDRISTAIALRDKVAETSPEAVTAHRRIACWKELQSQLGTASPAERLTIGRRILAIAALEEYLDRWFRHRKK